MNSVRTEITINTGIQKSCSGAKQTMNNLKNAANPAVLTTVLIKAVIRVGDPSYTSGVQKWNGAAPILKLKPIIIKVNPL